jgi:putative transposase
MEVKSTKGAKYNLNYHLVWCPKYRRKILVCSIAVRLGELFGEIAERWKVTLIAQEMMPDHIHLFISAPP